MDNQSASRWEWRIFSDAPFDSLAALFKRLRVSHSKNDTDTYIISAASGANIKVRNSVLDIKLLYDEHSHIGAEHWHPAFRCDFPPSAGDAEKISVCSGVILPASLPSEMPDGRVRGAEGLYSVTVCKKRRIYLVENTIIETGTADFCGIRKYTLCAECSNLSQIEYFVKGCHLEYCKVTNYVTMLKDILSSM